MLASLFIIVVSTGLFVYWFRYTCLLLLAQRSGAEYALRVASTIRLSFPQVEAALPASPRRAALDRVHQGLENDFRILTDLLGQANGSASIEHRILAFDYKIMKAWYRLTSMTAILAWPSTPKRDVVDFGLLCRSARADRIRVTSMKPCLAGHLRRLPRRSFL